MARLRYLQPQDIPAEYEDIAARRINLYRALAHNPAAARAFSVLGKYLKSSSAIDARLRELVTLQVGYETGCAYEFYHHVKIGYEAGVTDADIRAMIDESHGRPTTLGEVERAALKWARQLTRAFAVDDATYDALARVLPNEQLVDLAMTIGHYNNAVRIIACLGVDLEEGYEKLVEKFPLPARER